jgi:hypothetical protein
MNVSLGRFAGRVLLILGVPLVVAASAHAGRLETWRHDTVSGFAKGHRERIVISDTGRVRLGQAVKPLEGLDAAHVWDLALTQGVLYAATGNQGKVFERRGDAPWAVAYDVEDTQVLSLAVSPAGGVVAGTGPSGTVVEIDDPKHAASRPDPGVQYIWDLVFDSEGNLFAATGPTGQLWKRSVGGAWTLLFDAKQSHLLCVAIGRDGAVYTGSDGDGLIYRVTAEGKVSVVYDAPQSEVRTLLVAPDGVLFAGTAAETGGGPGSGPTRGLTSLGESSPGAIGGPVRASAAPQAKAAQRPAETSGGTAAPRPVTPGDNAVYRIGPDGAAREVFRARALIYALAWQGDRLLVGTGPEGQLYEVRGHASESAPLARLDHGQVLALATDPANGVLIGAGEPGAVLRLALDHAPSGTLTSEVHDTKLISRLGAVVWSADRPEGSSVSVQLRTGNVSEPDRTWSAWSTPLTASGQKTVVPSGRFVQYRLKLEANPLGATPEVRSVAVRFQTVNLAPELTRIDVPDLSEGDGAARQPRLNLKWDASDPNGDELSYTLSIRKEGWPDWVRLGETPLTEKNFAWDITAVPAGVYRVRVTASDRQGNPAEDALERELTSEPFIVDHQAPSVSVSAKGNLVAIELKDELTRLVKSAYALDGGDWVPIFPTDGLFDSPEESLTITLPSGLKQGTHIVMVRATDAAGNTGSGDAVLRVP